MTARSILLCLCIAFLYSLFFSVHQYVYRYYAIVHPMRAQYLCTLSQARKVITATWITSFALATPTLWIQVSKIPYINTRACSWLMLRKLITSNNSMT